MDVYYTEMIPQELKSLILNNLQLEELVSIHDLVDVVPSLNYLIKSSDYYTKLIKHDPEYNSDISPDDIFGALKIINDNMDNETYVDLFHEMYEKDLFGVNHKFIMIHVITSELRNVFNAIIEYNYENTFTDYMYIFDELSESIEDLGESLYYYLDRMMEKNRDVEFTEKVNEFKKEIKEYIKELETTDDEDDD